jgi:hypothetical protein
MEEWARKWLENQVYAMNKKRGDARITFKNPGSLKPIPEFPTIAIPIATILGLAFLLYRRKRKE